MKHRFTTRKNKEDLSVGGYFAYDSTDYSYVKELGNFSMVPRGFGQTRLQAIACLCAILDEQEGEAWGREPIKFL